MKIYIMSRVEADRLIKTRFPENVAVISFFTPNKSARDGALDYSKACKKVFYVGVHDVDRECLDRFGYTLESYLCEADQLAIFIREAVKEGRDIICQCDYGQSRSAACAAAIKQYYFGNGIEIFADYRYYPNQLVYNKIFEALSK